jgi:hypothetical protein
VFGCCESDLDEYFWRYSFYELKKRIELKVGETTASHLCIYTALAEVVAGAFGGKKGDKGPITEDLSQTSPEHFASRVTSMLSV